MRNTLDERQVPVKVLVEEWRAVHSNLLRKDAHMLLARQADLRPFTITEYLRGRILRPQRGHLRKLIDAARRANLACTAHLGDR